MLLHFPVTWGLILLTSFGRAELPPEASSWRTNGTRLMAQVESPSEPCTQAKLHSWQQLLDSGLPRVDWPPEYKEAPPNSPFDRLIGYSKYLARVGVFRDGDNRYYFDIAYSHNIDLIIARNTYRNDRTFWPWSEVVFEAYKAFYTQIMPPEWGKSVKDVKGIVRHYITNDATANLIVKILEDKPPTAPESGKLGEFANTDDYFLMLLGCPNGRAVAYFLFQHQADLGHKTIDRVEIWDAGKTQQQKQMYSLIFRFKDFAPQSKRAIGLAEGPGLRDHVPEGNHRAARKARKRRKF